MSRQHPLLSPIGCAGVVLLLIGVGVAMWFYGGAIFSPGPLTAYAQGQPIQGYTAHADFENDCLQCHVAGQGVLAEKCQVCHTTIAAERQSGLGVHGKLETEQVAQCAACHTDHKGRQFNPNELAIKRFDHSILGFVLDKHVVDYAGSVMACQSCHTSQDFQFEAQTCVQCHTDHAGAFMENHIQAFGTACRTCHDGVDKTSTFNHANTRFPLVGQHTQVECAACHTAQTPAAETPAQCAACHAEPPGHRGVFGESDCATCHTPQAWSPAALNGQTNFSHSQTDFQLIHHLMDYAGAPITCTVCHTNASRGDFSLATTACLDCHNTHDTNFMTAHVQKYGPNCVSCHDGAGNMTNFDHSQVFALEGRHAALECTACHQEQKFRGTPRECVACHAEPQIHAGVFGTQCEACHTAAAWAPAQLTRHTFPLDHGEEGEIACATCHTQSYATYTCTACHAQGEMEEHHAEKGITGEQLLACTQCHPTGRNPGDD